MDKDERTRRKGDSGRCAKQRSKKKYSKRRRNANKGKKLDRLSEVPMETGEVQVHGQGAREENSTFFSIADLEGTVSAKTIVNIEPEEHTSPSGFRLIDLGILSNVISLLACPECKMITCELSDKQQEKRIC